MVFPACGDHPQALAVEGNEFHVNIKLINNSSRGIYNFIKHYKPLPLHIYIYIYHYYIFSLVTPTVISHPTTKAGCLRRGYTARYRLQMTTVWNLYHTEFGWSTGVIWVQYLRSKIIQRWPKCCATKGELIYGVYPPFTDATGSVMFDPLISLLLSCGTTWNSWAFSSKILEAASDQAWVSGQAQMETATEFSSGALLMKARKTHLCWAICSQCLVVQEGSSSLEFGNLRRALHLQWPGTSVWNCSVASFTPWQYSQKWPSKSWRRKWRSGQGQVFQKQRLFVVFSN